MSDDPMDAELVDEITMELDRLVRDCEERRMAKPLESETSLHR
ncbi:MAG TPA: hypothetical protein VFE98_00285 [Candidatus Bathyarchaeia archaeon]|nr:hypothetical protein [Candidatus Bathyarchaeia archaeon]